MNYSKTTPCDNCPFRNDIRPYIRAERVEEICDGRGDFPCHKTTVADDSDEDGCDMRQTPNSQHCAGMLIMLEKMEQPHQMMRISERLGMYDRSKLDMEAPVYDDLEEMIEAHEMA